MMRKPKVKIYITFRTRKVRFKEATEFSTNKYTPIDVKRSSLICFMEEMSDEMEEEYN